MRGKDAKTTGRARSLRQSYTSAEGLLWSHIRNRRLNGYKFVRQEPIGRYYADFVCRERHLIVEVSMPKAKATATAMRNLLLSATG